MFTNRGTDCIWKKDNCKPNFRSTDVSTSPNSDGDQKREALADIPGHPPSQARPPWRMLGIGVGENTKPV